MSSMEPIGTMTVVIVLVDWKKVISSLGTDAAKGGAKSLLNRLRLDEREKAAKDVVGFFGEQFLREAEDTTALSSAVLVVILGDPGSGETSLLKYRLVRGICGSQVRSNGGRKLVPLSRRA